MLQSITSSSLARVVRKVVPVMPRTDTQSADRRDFRSLYRVDRPVVPVTPRTDTQSKGLHLINDACIMMRSSCQGTRRACTIDAFLLPGN